MALPGLQIVLRDYEQRWALLDDTLYRLCRDHPDHRDPGAVHAKLWLIGRSYTTGIERAIKANGAMGGSMSALAAEMIRQGGKLNELFSELRSISEPLNVEKAKQIARLHGRFLELIRRPMRPKISPRSFASKYMHFHCSAVPIIDSYADRRLKQLVPWKRATQFELPAEADAYYGWFVMRFLTPYLESTGGGVPISVKALDAYLLAA